MRIFGAIMLLFVFVSSATAESAPSKSALDKVKFGFSKCRNAIQTLGQFVSPIESIDHFTHESTKSAKVLRGLQDLAIFAEVFLTPLPRTLIGSPTKKIFYRLWKNPKYEPNEADLKILKKYKALEIFKRKKEFMLRWPRWVKFQRVTVEFRRWALMVSLGLALNHQLQVGATTVVNRDQFLTSPAYALQPNQVQIINEVVPFPHTALRLGDKVYSYGFSHLAVRPVREYLINKSEADLYFLQQAQQEGSSFYSLVTPFAKTLENAPRSVQVITLNLSAEEYAALHRDLEMSTGNAYCNITFVNDCTTMALRSLDENAGVFSSRFFDASPSQTAFYFSAAESLGSSRVARIDQVAIDRTDAPAMHIIRNFSINVMESKFFIDLFLWNQGHRLWVDLTKSKNELQYREADVQQEIDSWQKIVDAEIDADDQISVFDRLIRNIEPITEDTPKTELIKNQVARIFESMIDESLSMMKTPSASFKDIVQNRMKALALISRYKVFLDRLRVPERDQSRIFIDQKLREVRNFLPNRFDQAESQSQSPLP